MGYMSTVGFAEAVEDGQATVEQAIYWHVRANFYPPLPEEYVQILSRVIRGINDHGDPVDGEVHLPGDLNPVPMQATWDESLSCWVLKAYDLRNATHAWPFLTLGLS